MKIEDEFESESVTSGSLYRFIKVRKNYEKLHNNWPSVISGNNHGFGYFESQSSSLRR